MIAQGSDGLSRGKSNVGVMAGKKMLDFVPIHKSCLDRCNLVKAWLLDWMGDDPIEFLTSKQWFSRGHDLADGEWDINVDGMKMPVVKPGFFVWSPPPAAAVAAIEELRKARHKRQDSHHIFIVPRLMQPEWRKQYTRPPILLCLFLSVTPSGLKLCMNL